MTRAAMTSLLALWLLVSGCGSEASSTSSTPGDADRRIVCLVPSVSLMLKDLGLADEVVGVGQRDPLAGDGRQVVGNFIAVDIEQLLAAKPDLVITLRSKESPSPRLRELAEAGHFELIALPYPRGIDAVADTLHQDGPDNDLGDHLGVSDKAKALRRRMLDQLDAVRRRTADAEAKSVLICIGLSPVMASGPGTVNDRLLEIIHATNAAADASVTAPTFDREMLLAMRPDVIVLLQPGAKPLDGADDHRLRDFAGLDIPAVHNDRIHLINDPHAMLPSTNLPGLARQLAQVVHGIAIEPAAEPGDA